MDIWKLLLLTLLMLAALMTSSQNEFANVQLPAKRIDSYWVIPDDQGSICIQYFKKPYIYFEILEKYHDLTPPVAGTIWRSNFYKCADESSHPHWLTWAPINFPRPSFHIPEFFGTLEFL